MSDVGQHQHLVVPIGHFGGCMTDSTLRSYDGFVQIARVVRRRRHVRNTIEGASERVREKAYEKDTIERASERTNANEGADMGQCRNINGLPLSIYLCRRAVHRVVGSGCLEHSIHVSAQICSANRTTFYTS